MPPYDLVLQHIFSWSFALNHNSPATRHLLADMEAREVDLVVVRAGSNA